MPKPRRRSLALRIFLGLALPCALVPATAALFEGGASPAKPSAGRAVPGPAAASAPARAPAAAPAPPVLLDIQRWLLPGEFVWNDDDVPEAPQLIVVDLKARLMSVYRSGVEIGRASIIYGSDEKPTPLGAFPILEKDADHRSRTYGNAPMPYMLRLTKDGVSIHGAQVGDDLATHGCVGLPKAFAELLFAKARLGDRVLITRGPPDGVAYTAYAALPRVRT